MHLQPIYLLSVLWPLLIAGLASTISVVAFPQLALWIVTLLVAWISSFVSVHRGIKALVAEMPPPPLALPVLV